MKNILVLYLIVLLISSIFTSTDSQCLQTKESIERRRLSTTISEMDCHSFVTSDVNFICVLSEEGHSCDEVSECIYTNYWDLEVNFPYNELEPLYSDKFTDEYCEVLMTSDDEIYICVANSDGSGCKETNGSKTFGLSFALLCFLFLL